MVVLIVHPGDNVKLKDGRLVYVTDAASHNPEDYMTFDEVDNTGFSTLVSQLPVETIFVGECAGRVIVSDMSEVVSVLSHTVL